MLECCQEVIRMYEYIRKLISLGFNTYLTYSIIHYFNYNCDILDDFISFIEGDETCSQCGENLIIIQLVGEELETAQLEQ